VYLSSKFYWLKTDSFVSCYLLLLVLSLGFCPLQLDLSLFGSSPTFLPWFDITVVSCFLTSLSSSIKFQQCKSKFDNLRISFNKNAPSLSIVVQQILFFPPAWEYDLFYHLISLSLQWILYFFLSFSLCLQCYCFDKSCLSEWISLLYFKSWANSWILELPSSFFSYFLVDFILSE